ncbi:MAG: hypothetical protein LUG96_03975 [Tannerellaceae bacterium]|nr:hypothetical protein [Tannerellaceae bacterium]
MKNKLELLAYGIGVSFCIILLYKGLITIMGTQNVLYETLYVIPILLIISFFIYFYKR